MSALLILVGLIFLIPGLILISVVESVERELERDNVTSTISGVCAGLIIIGLILIIISGKIGA